MGATFARCRGVRLGLGVVVALATALGVALGTAGPAGAHAEEVSSSPAAGATLRTAPERIVLVFEERPDPALSSIEVRDASGGLRAGGVPRAASGQPNGLTLPAPVLPAGRYTVVWRAVSAVDGHAEEGSFPFGVGVPSAMPRTSPKGSPAAPSWAEVGARWVYYLGVSGLIGLAVVALFVFRPAPGQVVRRGLWWSWAGAVAGAVGIALAEASVDGVGPARLLSSSAGPGALGRVAPLLEAALPIAVVAWRGRLRRGALILVGGYAALSMVADVRASHAAAVRSWAWLHQAVLLTHFLAVGVWIGGLAAVVACLPRMDRARRAGGLARYSGIAAVALFAVAGTGLVEAVAEVRTRRALMATTFGHLVLVKVAVVLVLATLGALNRWRHLPASSGSTSPLRRVALTEVGLAVGALIVAAALPGFSPGGEAAGS